MKTTSGKTKAPRREARPVDIFNQFGSKVATRKASSLKQALLEYHKDKLEPLGFKRISTTGNVMYVQQNHPDALMHRFVAKDQSSLETRNIKEGA